MRSGIRALTILFALLPAVAGCNPGNNKSNLERGLQAMQRGDYGEAYYYWRPLADSGHPQAQYHLGWLYANGNGLRVDGDKAVEWWEKAARQGHKDAQFALGMAYFTGQGIKMDSSRGLGWFVTAARGGLEDAQEILLRLNGDPKVGLLEKFPQLLEEPWFGAAGTVTADRANLRSSPSTDAPVIGQLERGTEVRILGQQADWYRIDPRVLGEQADSAAEAWIYANLLE